MVHSCAALNCTNRWKKGGSKFHRIPLTDVNLRKAWLHAIKRKDYNPKNASICEKHFLESDYELNIHGNRMLKKGVVPSVFSFPKDLQNLDKVLEENQPPETTVVVFSNDNVGDRIEVDQIEEQVEEEQIEELPALAANVQEIHYALPTAANPALKRRMRGPVYFGDFKKSDMNNEQTRDRFWNIAHDTVLKYRMMAKYHQRKIRRQRAQIKKLNALLKELNKKQNISSMQM
ncbi:THAP domain-containing protein 1-like [Anthonomus grandis grandis]|uniref:THAP domain-containing protein 1-like n=1 Tax=Anthonomus grandis grandis TaxID=2921223 RepID=UPI0021668A5D|nr:THAP domain-containing protein 1-like [Anthonomus grandis grandis]XP_050299349.1 THAP domain-containing protein 1-like [Anthonomus grandis grandis]XP_050299350.1 THAP domain-containing protein 1-like [Anthonomus grandis grandis]XP_050299351.1 THAP domain-containing protein 1-like [Anthonomus grandis grandis]XP_050299352.1 THAP domain-containing protein 1-like [Anthonomus grandis grandis]